MGCGGQRGSVTPQCPIPFLFPQVPGPSYDCGEVLIKVWASFRAEKTKPSKHVVMSWRSGIHSYPNLDFLLCARPQGMMWNKEGSIPMSWS